MKHTIENIYALVHPYEVPVTILTIVGLLVVGGYILLLLNALQLRFRFRRFMKLNNGVDEGLE
jgi:hypothetical protein